MQSREVRRAGAFATKAAATVTEKVYFDITIGGKEAGKLPSETVGWKLHRGAWQLWTENAVRRAHCVWPVR